MFIVSEPAPPEDIAEGRGHFDQAIALYDPAEHRPLATRFGQDTAVMILVFRSWALWLLGYPEAALRDADDALRNARELGQAATLMHGLLIPKIALAPLFIVWLGVGSRSGIVVGIFIAFFPVVVSTATGLVSAKPEVLLLCRSLTASEWQMFRLARFPYAMPFVFGGMKVGVTMAMIGVIVGEFITAQAGLGYIIMFASSAGETATVLAAIVLLCGIGLALYGIVALGELALLRWYGGEMPVGGVI